MSKIVVIKTILDVLDFLKPNENIALFFDIDKTLLIPASHIDLRKMVLRAAMKRLAQGILPSSSVIEEILYEIFNDPQFAVQTPEPTTPFVIQSIKDQGLKVGAITARFPSVAHCTLNHLKSVNINFADSALHPNELPMTDDNSTLLKDGILFCGRNNEKGIILNILLHMLDNFPEKIILVDDELHHIHSVGNAVEKLGILFIGMHYKPY